MMRTVFFMTGMVIAISFSMVAEATMASDDVPLLDAPPDLEQKRTSDQNSAVDICPGSDDTITWDQVFENLSLPAENAPLYLKIPTYDGSGQCVHPDIMVFPEAWNGYRYWMAMTPYPNSNDRYENPSIVASNDNINWTDPVQNPLIGQPSGTHNSDTEWIFVKGEERVHLMYRKGEWELFVMSSPNGLDWSSKSLQVFNGTRSNCCLSPAVVSEGNGSLRMWMVNGKGSPNTLMTYVRKGSPDGPWDLQGNCTVENLPKGRDIWHIDVIRCAGGKFYLALLVLADMDKTINTTLHLGLSSDGMNWTISESEAISASRNSWDNDMIYRASSAVLDGEDRDRLGIWYSARSSGGRWHIGYTEMDLNVSWIAQRVRPSVKPVFSHDRSSPRSYYNGSSFNNNGTDNYNGSIPEPVRDNPANGYRDEVDRNDGQGNEIPRSQDSDNSSIDGDIPDVKDDNTNRSRSTDPTKGPGETDIEDNSTGYPIDIPSPDNSSSGEIESYPDQRAGNWTVNDDDRNSIIGGGGKKGFPLPVIAFLTVFLSLVSMTFWPTGQVDGFPRRGA
ncbi:MAG: hypothetical protein ACMUHM_04830 [Thermoplasmatota archaeon]